MSIHQPHGIAARPARAAAKAMVAVLAGPDTPLVATPAELPHWRALTPLALWSTVTVRNTNPDEILRGIAAELAQQRVEASRLILLAEGKAARTALTMRGRAELGASEGRERLGGVLRFCSLTGAARSPLMRQRTSSAGDASPPRKPRMASSRSGRK